jgi:hypothetical protein
MAMTLLTSNTVTKRILTVILSVPA